MPRVRPTVRALSGLLTHAGAAPALAAAPGPPETTITAKALLKDVEALASPRYGGRLAGIPGYEEAARWAAKRFEKLGLRRGGEDGYLQRLPLEFHAIETCRLAVRPVEGPARPLALGTDFICRGFTGSGQVSAPVVFAGFGLTLPDKGWDEYAGLDVKGKIVLVFKDAPPFDPPKTAEGAAKGWCGRPPILDRGWARFSPSRMPSRRSPSAAKSARA